MYMVSAGTLGGRDDFRLGIVGRMGERISIA